MNLWFFHRLVASVGVTTEEGPTRASAVLLGARYLIFGAAGYVIVDSFEASLPAALIGCFVAIVAVLLEIIYQLIYGT